MRPEFTSLLGAPVALGLALSPHGKYLLFTKVELSARAQGRYPVIQLAS